ETAATRRSVRERRHHVAGTGAAHPLVGRNEPDVTDLVAQPVIRHRLERDHRVQVVRIRDALEQVDRREPARDRTITRTPADPTHRDLLHGRLRRPGRRAVTHGHPPRSASRYRRTSYRSATCPDSIRSSAERPPNGFASFG